MIGVNGMMILDEVRSHIDDDTATEIDDTADNPGLHYDQNEQGQEGKEDEEEDE